MKFIYTFIFTILLLQLDAQQLGSHLISNGGAVMSNENCQLYSAVGEPMNTNISLNNETIQQGVMPSVFSGGMLDPNTADCASNNGLIFFEDCDDGVEYFFISSNGLTLDPYYDDGVSFSHLDGQRVNFAYVDADFESPCSFADKAVIVTCIEEASGLQFGLEPGEYNYSACQAETFILDVSVPPGPGETESPCNGQGTVSGDLQNFSGYTPNEDGTLTVTVFANSTFNYTINVSGPDGIPCNLEWTFNFNIDQTCNSNNVDESYPWIFDTELVDSLNCEGVTISEYEVDGQPYIYIVTEDSAIIYSPSGMPNCVAQPDGTSDCATLEDFGLTDPINVWECPTDVYIPNCAANLGTIFFENCDDGVEYFFIDTGQDVIYDPYYGEGVSFQHQDGMKVNYDFVDANFDTPCSNADRAIIITCIEENVVSNNELPEEDAPIEIFPNPTTNKVTLRALWLNQLKPSIEIYNSVGSLVLKPVLDFSNKDSVILDLETLESGIYFLSIVREGNPMIEKLVITN